MREEYLRITVIVTEFDQRLLTVKSWGVTFSLATLVLGFSGGHYGLFLVAAAAALSFWLIEWSVKRHQVRYYPRMGDIEYEAHVLFGVERKDGGVSSSPMIDWSWYTALPRVFGASGAWGADGRDVGEVAGGQDAREVASGKNARRAAPGTRDPHPSHPWADVNPNPGAYGRMLFWPSIACRTWSSLPWDSSSS
ncbi:hypothetical protein [Propioniciclava sinopodophylli]|uniref:hypothetical protein n=1 Tax=Propioniciclava sinopodophylli TaxID=1837344 RepID=UPI002491285C|nr:hypothetical protein [Propioniciclava sinopodophylli]